MAGLREIARSGRVEVDYDQRLHNLNLNLNISSGYSLPPSGEGWERTLHQCDLGTRAV